MKTAIRKHLRDFIAIIVLIALAALVGGYILAHQRIYLPAWVPVFGKSYYTLKGEFETAQAVTPGQGQTVDIAGVAVGDISKVDLEDGRALVTMRVRKKYDEIYPNATMLLRPKTGLKDMIVELDPGSPAGGKPLKSGSTIPVSQTEPDVNLDEVLSSLDVDTRNYLQLLLNGAGTGLNDNGSDLAQVFRRFDPTSRDLQKITQLVAQRRTNLRRVIHNFGEVTNALGDRDQQLRTFVSSSADVFRHLANQSQNIEQTVDLLPGTLQDTQTALRRTTGLANQLGPALDALQPAAVALGPSLKATQPFLKQATPVVENQLAPFTKTATPIVADTRAAAKNLSVAAKPLTGAFGQLNDLFNMLAYNPPGKAEGYLFYAAWLSHLTNSIFTGQDALGPFRRTVIGIECTRLQGTNSIINQDRGASAGLAVLAQLIQLPRSTTKDPGYCTGPKDNLQDPLTSTTPTPPPATTASVTPTSNTNP